MSKLKVGRHSKLLGNAKVMFRKTELGSRSGGGGSAALAGAQAPAQSKQKPKPKLELNTKLHIELIKSGGVKASTFASATAALARIRAARGG